MPDVSGDAFDAENILTLSTLPRSNKNKLPTYDDDELKDMESGIIGDPDNDDDPHRQQGCVHQ